MSDEIDKAALYGRYQEQEDARLALGMKAAHKALDIPQDDMQITSTTNNTTTGVGTKELLLGLGAIGIPAAMLVGYLLWRGGPTAPEVKPATVGYEAIYEQQQSDGTWKELRREPLGAKK